MNKSIKLDVFGKLVLAIHTNDGWEVFYLSEGGKRRLATEIFVPIFVKEAEIENYIEDICHEWATEKHPNVRRLNSTDDDMVQSTWSIYAGFTRHDVLRT